MTQDKLPGRGLAYLDASKKYDDRLDNIISKASLRPDDHGGAPVIDADETGEERPAQATAKPLGAVRAPTVHSNLTFKLPTENSPRHLGAKT